MNTMTKAARRAQLARDFETINPEVVAHLRDFAPTNRFYADLLDKLSYYGTLTDGQVAAVERNMATDHARRAERAERIASGITVPTGKHTICGTVVKVKEHNNGFGWRYVMTVRDDRGFTVWGTVPAALGDVEPGERVTFCATVQPADSDPTFGFYSRPTKATRD